MEQLLKFEDWVIEKVQEYPFVTPSALASKGWYKGYKLKFTEARALAEKVKSDYLSKQK